MRKWKCHKYISPHSVARYTGVSVLHCTMSRYKFFPSLGLSPSTVGSPRLVSGMAPNQGPSVFPITLPTVLGEALRLSPSTVGSPRLVSGMAPNQGPSVFPIALPAVLGDTLIRSPHVETYASLDSSTFQHSQWEPCTLDSNSSGPRGITSDRNGAWPRQYPCRGKT